MPYQTFNELNADAMALYREQKYGEVLDLLTREGGAFPADMQQVLYLRSCMAVRVGQTDEGLRLIEEVLDRGGWYGEELLRRTPSWAGLQGQPAFEALAERHMARAAEAMAGARPLRLVRMPPGDPPLGGYPLMLSLHGNTQQAAPDVAAWGGIAARGWILAAIQSSQVAGPDMFIWDNQDKALAEIADHYAALDAEYPLDPARVVIAGFSMGGETALRAALNGTVPAGGFVLLGPGGPTMDTPDAWLPLLDGAAARGLRGVILLGSADVDLPQAEIRRLADLLTAHGIPTRLIDLPGLAHDYPPDPVATLTEALAFIYP
jgi:dienelactone hydrolase